VHPDYRRQGGGSLLLDAAEQRLAALGATRFDAMVLEGNELGPPHGGLADMPLKKRGADGCEQQLRRQVPDGSRSPRTRLRTLHVRHALPRFDRLDTVDP